jgi:hypothetical protein
MRKIMINFAAAIAAPVSWMASMRTVRRGGLGLFAAAAVVLSAQSAVLASSAPPTWTKQHPAASPSARWDAGMAYDAATGNIVLFGGGSDGDKSLGDTWTWDGSTWTKQHPAARPFTRAYAAVAYDAATSNIVLFGGLHFGCPCTGYLRSTWTWGGSG